MKKLTPLFVVFLSVITLSVPANADVLYSTFGPGQSFDNIGWRVGAGSSYSNNQQIAAPFTLSFDAILDSIDFAADYDLDPNQLTVNLVHSEDDSGLPSTDPGKVIESFNFTNLSPLPTIYTGKSLLKPLLKGSTQYWVVLRTDDTTTRLWWNQNNIGRTGFAFCNPPAGTPWIYYRDKTPAFDIKGNSAVPDPFKVYIDIKPGSCPNPINVKSWGVLPVAILGTADFDVTQIKVSSIRLVGVAPQPFGSAIEDVAAPFPGVIQDTPSCQDCIVTGPDGFNDLTLKFSTQEIARALGEVNDEECVVLELTGELNDGTPIAGEDVVRILNKRQRLGSGGK